MSISVGKIVQKVQKKDDIVVVVASSRTDLDDDVFDDVKSVSALDVVKIKLAVVVAMCPLVLGKFRCVSPNNIF